MQLVGQSKIKDFIDNLTLENCPHFIILTGSRRSGRTYITQLIAEKLNALKSEFQPGADSVRQIISTIYTIKQPCVYWCEDMDKMYPAAKNSLLKVTEETPKNAYIILHSVGTVMATLNSRARVIKLEPYSFEDYVQYCTLKNINIDASEYEVLMKSCNSLADFEYYIESGKYDEVKELAGKVLDYMGEVSKVNAYKILNKLALKKDAEGIDPVFFLTVLINMYIERKGQVEFGDIIVKESQKTLSLLQGNNFYKPAIMDRWVLQIMKGIDERC